MAIDQTDAPGRNAGDAWHPETVAGAEDQRDMETWQYLADVVPGITRRLEAFHESGEPTALYAYSGDSAKDEAVVMEIFDMTGADPEAARSAPGKVNIRLAPAVAARVEAHLVDQHNLSLGEEFASGRVLKETEFAEFDMNEGGFLQGLRFYTYTMRPDLPEGAPAEYDTVPHVVYVAVGRSAFAGSRQPGASA